jgi:hypothetical protein
LGTNPHRLTLGLLIGCLLAGMVVLPNAKAATAYSYLDDQGNLVYTDTIDTVPDKYRPRVRSHVQPDPVTPSPSFLQSAQRMLGDKVHDLGFKTPAFVMGVEGVSQNQSHILTYAGAMAVVLLVVMYLSKSPLMRLLSLCLLILLGIGTPVLIYVSDGGPMDVMKNKASAAGHAQQERLRQVSH